MREKNKRWNSNCENWRRRPDLNRGWRFCRFNGVVNRDVSCWSLVGPAPSFYPVFGQYWTTSGLLHSRFLQQPFLQSFDSLGDV